MIPLPFILLFWVQVYTPFPCFLSREDPLAFGEDHLAPCLVVLNSLSFCLSVKLFVSSYLNEILAGYSNLCCKFFSFITLRMSCHSILAWRVSIERSAVINFLFYPLYSYINLPLFITPEAPFYLLDGMLPDSWIFE